MKDLECWNYLRRIMNEQAELVERFNREEEELRQSLYKKDWLSLEKATDQLNIYADQIKHLEEKRHEAFSEIKHELHLHEEVSFLRTISQLPENLRDELKVLYEKLRHEVFMTSAKLESLRSYTEARVSLIKGILEELIPDTRGKVYNPKGIPVTAGTGSLIFNARM